MSKENPQSIPVEHVINKDGSVSFPVIGVTMSEQTVRRQFPKLFPKEPTDEQTNSQPEPLIFPIDGEITPESGLQIAI